MPKALVVAPYAQLNGYLKRPTFLTCVVDIGATGAPTVNTTLGASGFTVTRSGAGTYTATMPTGRKAVVLGTATIRDAANNSADWVSVRTVNAPAGTFTFDTATSGTSADLTSGAQLHISFMIEGT